MISRLIILTLLKIGILQKPYLNKVNRYVRILICSQDNAIDDSAFEMALDLQKHRGPDSTRIVNTSDIK